MWISKQISFLIFALFLLSCNIEAVDLRIFKIGLAKSYARGVWNVQQLKNSPIRTTDKNEVRQVVFQWKSRPPKRDKCAISLNLRIRQGFGATAPVIWAAPVPGLQFSSKVLTIQTNWILNNLIPNLPQYYFFEIASPICRKVYSQSAPQPVVVRESRKRTMIKDMRSVSSPDLGRSNLNSLPVDRKLYLEVFEAVMSDNPSRVRMLRFNNPDKLAEIERYKRIIDAN